MTSTLDSFPPPTTDPATSSTDPTPGPNRPTPSTPRRHSAGHVVAIVAGALALFPGFGMLAGGTAAAIAQGVATDDGYFTFTPDRVASDGVAVVTDDAWLDADDGGPWVLDWLDVDVRLRADGAGSTDDVFVGIARTADVEAYLDGTAYSVVEEIDGRDIRYRQEPGDSSVVTSLDAPEDLDIWVASARGTGEQELEWEARGGRWTVVVMNGDGTPDLSADVEVGVRSDAVTPIAVTLMVFGGLTVLAGIGLIVFGVRGRRPLS